MKDKQRDDDTTAANTSGMRDATAKKAARIKGRQRKDKKMTSCESCSVKIRFKKRFNLQLRLLQQVERAESQSEEPSACPLEELHANTVHPVSSCFMIRSLSSTPCVNMM